MRRVDGKRPDHHPVLVCSSRAFTLTELLVVLVIIAVISVAALPTVLPAIQHRQVTEAAQLLQGALVGARDKAIHDRAPSGIRLLPDPGFNSVKADAILAYNRVVPLETPPEYTEGLVTVQPESAWIPMLLPYPGGGAYPAYGAIAGANVLVLEESVSDPQSGAPNPPTSWSWNARLGDRIQLNGSGPWYTVVGPFTVQNQEGFVNWGLPGTPSPLVRNRARVDFLLLVNGVDDNGNGWTDEGWDGVDNFELGSIDSIGDWLQGEVETWRGSIPTQGLTNAPYAIRRRPLPGPNAREIALPSQVVIDFTSWATTRERSRVPAGMFNTQSGAVDIMLNPDGTVVPSVAYSAPSSLGMDGAFIHLWLAERADLTAPSGTTAPVLTLPKGEYRLLTLFSRTGQITIHENPPLVSTMGSYSANAAYAPAQQGDR